ncbi:uncharacterized protein BXZ73DRAFT_103139 [Epithele typhae]|uniref:uncharacterized protein n=1 Tax=Epithele typhae TaxID=378194 RepID=UPI0020073CBA|nr:uncharacterized protein BXZ73DRAFT_103139 [Epithele typhae]KAH9925601.1 hypothetical protein BXZ73DRAFT_103139 [Epithele typhae]
MPLSINQPSNTSSPLSSTNSREEDAHTCRDIDLRCAVTGQGDATLLKRTQIIPFDTPREQLDKLEFSWGVERNSIDVDIPRISLHSRPALVLFGTNGDQPTGWFLIPTDLNLLGKVSTYSETTDKKGDINECYDGAAQFKYSLVAFPSMQECSYVVKYTGDVSSEGRLRSNCDVQRFQYPFTDFGPIYLPVPYHYIIVHTGAKLLRVYPKGLTHYGDFLPYDAFDVIAIINTAMIYENWMETTMSDDKDEDDEEYDEDDEE